MQENDVANQFTRIAPVVSVKLIRDKMTSKPVGYGFVEFPTNQVATEVFETLNG